MNALHFSAPSLYKVDFDLLKEFLDGMNLAEQYDVLSSNESLDYSSLEVEKSLEMDFDVSQEKVLSLLSEKNHCHISLLDWRKDSPIVELVDIIEDFLYQETKLNIEISDLVLLVGPHNYQDLSDKNNQVFSSFSISFQLKEELDYKLIDKLTKTSSFKEQKVMLEEIFDVEMKNCLSQI